MAQTRDILGKVEINVPLLDAIQEMPKCAKFLKEIFKRHKNKKEDIITPSQMVATIEQQKLPPKLWDTGLFTLPRNIGKLEIANALIDMGASVSMMPLSLYQ